MRAVILHRGKCAAKSSHLNRFYKYKIFEELRAQFDDARRENPTAAFFVPVERDKKNWRRVLMRALESTVREWNDVSTHVRLERVGARERRVLPRSFNLFGTERKSDTDFGHSVFFTEMTTETFREAKKVVESDLAKSVKVFKRWNQGSMKEEEGSEGTPDEDRDSDDDGDKREEAQGDRGMCLVVTNMSAAKNLYFLSLQKYVAMDRESGGFRVVMGTPSTDVEASRKRDGESVDEAPSVLRKRPPSEEKLSPSYFLLRDLVEKKKREDSLTTIDDDTVQKSSSLVAHGLLPGSSEEFLASVAETDAEREISRTLVSAYRETQDLVDAILTKSRRGPLEAIITELGFRVPFFFFSERIRIRVQSMNTPTG